MDVKPYQLPEDKKAKLVSEPVAAYPSQNYQLDVLRHQVMDAVASSDDQITLVMCLQMLNDKRKHTRARRGLTDEELEAKLACYPSWEETKHADLSQVDYSKYKPYRSAKVLKSIEKWL